MRVAIDIEANGLHPDTVHCICAADLDSDRVWDFWGSTLKDFSAFVAKASLVVVHNGIDYDLPVLEALLHVVVPEPVVQDTLVISRLMDQQLEGGHSLDAWGKRLGSAKVGAEIEDWSRLTPLMLERCRQDAKLTKALYFHLLTKAKLDFKGAFDRAWVLEHETAFICQDMHRNGFHFDYQAAQELRAEVEKQVVEIDEKLQEAFPPKVERIELKTKVKEVVTPFNPGSPKQIVERLRGHWKPTSKTEKGNPKVNEENLATLKDSAPEAAKLLVKRLMLASRVRKVDEWFKSYNPDTHRIHARFNPLGTWTGRMSHSEPNLGNIAAPKSIKYKGKELASMATALGGRMRMLWQASPGAWLVGTDAEGIQLRLFGHYIKDDKFIEALVSGDKKLGTDAHSINAGILGCDRDTAKTFIYAFLLGAGDRKIGEILGTDTAGGKRAKADFTRAYPGLARLKEQAIPADAKRGYFTGLDGRLVKCDSEHHMLAGYLQNGEAVIMKLANTIWRKELHEHLGTAWRQVNFVHDEWQTEVFGTEEEARKAGEIQARAIVMAGEELSCYCPMAGEYKIGKNWLDTH